MDMLINLTDNITVALSPPGSVQLKLNLPPGMDADRVKIFKTWLDSRNYITPDKFRTWGESVVDKSLNTLPKHNNLPMVSGKEGHYVVLKNSKSGPAFTLRVNKLNTNIIFDIDIVFCLEFKNWPSNFPNYGVSVNEWQAVPKTPKLQLGEGYKNWRYSFPKYEKDLISGTYHLRSVIKLVFMFHIKILHDLNISFISIFLQIKKLRDTNNMSYLYSYSIKSIFLWELKNKNGLKWNDSVGYLFVMMLKKLKEYIDSGKIPFYWDKNSNLLDSLSPNQLNDCKITLNRLLRDIEKCVENPNDLTKILLTSEEQQSFAN